MSNNSVKVDPQLVKQLQQHFAPLYENVTQTLSPVEMAQLQKAYGFSQSRQRQISEKERTANLEAFNLNLQAQSKAMGEQFVLNTQDKPVEERYRAWEQAQEALKRQYANLSEEQQNLALSAFNEVADVFAKADKDAGFFARTGDALSYIPSTLTKLGEQATGLVSPDGSARQWFKSATEEVESWRSDEAKLRALKSSDAMAAAKARGELGFTQFFDNAIDNPLETIGQFAESALPTIGAALVGTAAAPVTGGLSLGLPLAIGGLQGAGETRNQIYDHIMAMPEAQLAQNEQYQALTAQGFTSEQARAMLASSLKEHGGEVLATGVSSAVLSKLGGLGRIGQVGNGVMGSTAGKFASELVTEPMDEVFQQFMGNKAIRDIDKNHSLTDGLGEAAAGGLLFGAMGGGVAAADNIYRKPSESQVKQSQDDDIDNLTQSNNTDNNQAQPQAQPQTQPQNTATSVNEQVLERVLADYQSQVEESTYEDVYDSLKADIRDGLITERAKSNTQYGQFARDYLAQTGQGTQTTERTKGEDPSVENGNVQANAQAESAVENSTISEPTTETEQDLETKAEKALYSRSPIKSVEANIKRGQARMTQAILDKADVKRGMFNGEFGWVDFVWGDDGTTKPLGRNGEPVGRGIAHIFEARERKDGQSYQETSQMLVNNIVNTIAKGQVTSRTPSRIVLEYKDNPNALGHKAVLTKDKGYNGNAWVLTAFENDPTKGRKANSEGETKMGYDKLSPTQNTATLSRDGLGASEMHQPMNQSRGATTSDLRINSPIRSRTEMGAIGTNNVQQSTPQSNNQTEQNPEIEQAREVLRNALGEHADRITFVRTADFDLNNKKERVKAGAEGFYQNGKLYINLDNIHENEVQTKEERLIWVAWHELAHSGVDVRYKNVLSATMQIAQQHVVVSGIARRVKAEYQAEGLEIDDNKATEEALVELYAAQQTGNWAEIESRYKVKIHHSWKSEQGGLGKHLSRIAGIFKRLISAVTGKNLEGISDQQLFDILAGIKQGINDVANVQQNSTAYSPTNEARYSFAGINAKNADLVSRGRAAARVADGENAETVRQETGWFKGADNQWRFEVNEDPELINPYQAYDDFRWETEYQQDEFVTTLGEVWKDKRLFEAYPHLAGRKLTIKPLTKSGGYFDPVTGEIVLSSHLGESVMREALVHEVQHAIQYMEGFLNGSNPEAELARFSPDGLTGNKSVDQEIRKKQEELASTQDPTRIAELQEDIREYQRMVADNNYRRSAGEVEARNAQRRIKMTENERLQNSPESTEDVPRANQILRDDSGKSYSLNENADSEFARAVDAVASGGKPSKQYIPMGTTPNVLKMLGVPNVNVTINRDVLSKVMLNKHNVTAETLKQLPTQINNPVAVMKSAPQATQQGYVVLTELVEENALTAQKEPVISALHLRSTKDGMEVINIASVYGKNLRGMQNMLNHDLLYWNKEKGSQFVDAFGLQLPAKVASNDVSQFGKDIKTDDDLSQYQAENSADNARFSRRQDLSKTAYDQAKSDGRTKLTFEQWKQVRSPEFKAWFGDWENDPENASKVIDPKTGEPLVVYRADSAEINKFDKRKAKQGFFFTSSKNVAQMYGSNVREFFLNLRMPKVNNRALPNQNNALDIKNSDFDGVLNAKAYGNSNEYIVVSSNQIKSATDNNGNFDPNNADIRFSRRIASLKRTDVSLDPKMVDGEKYFMNFNKKPKTLSDLLGESWVLQAYPELSDIAIHQSKFGSEFFVYNEETNTISISPDSDVKTIEKNLFALLKEKTKPLQPQVAKETMSETKENYFSDDEYLDLAKRYEQGDMSVEARLRELVDNRAKEKGFAKPDYRMSHEAPNRSDDISQSLDDLSGIYPDDLYSPNGYKRYGSGYAQMDREAWEILNEIRGNPEADVWIYRAYPKGTGGTITNGDWVTIVRDYAVVHGESNINGRYEIVSKKVKAKDVFTNGDSLLEQGYDNGLSEVVNDKKKIKRDELINYDDKGEIIPLSQRFNSRKNDIRYSRRARTNDEFANAVPKRTANSFEQAREIVSELLGEHLVNRETGMVATISKRSLSKLLSGKAHAKSTNLNDHLIAVANIDMLFENAITGWVEPHKSDTVNIAGMHKLFAPLLIDGEMKLAKVTVKEMNFNQGNKIYSVETIEVENENGTVPEMTEVLTDNSNIAPHRLHSTAVQSLIQRIKDFNSSTENNDDETHYSRRQTVEELVSSGKAKAEPTVFDDLKAKDYKGFVQRVNKATGKVDEWVADALRPVNDWIDGLVKRGLSEYETEQLKGDMYRAKGVRDSINTELTQAYLKPIIKKVGEIAKAHKMDELTAKRMVGYWISGRYSIEKNRSLLRDELVAMREAKEALDKAIAKNGDIETAEAVYRKAERQYRYRKHDVGLPLNSTADFKVGTAGGWSIAEAENFMRNIEKRIPRKKLEEVAELVYDLNQHRLDLDHHVGRYTEEQYQTYKKNRHYVPLTGDPNAEEDFDGISGAGQNAVNVSKDKALKGRKLSEAEDGIDASWRAINKSSTYAGWADFKNRIDEIYETKVAELVEQGYSQRSAREEAEETLGITKSEMQPGTRSNDNVLIRKVGGVYYEYSLPTDVMTALKNDNVEHANSFLTLLSKPTSWYARGVTQWTITFAPMNMMRDTWEKSEFIRVQKLFDKNGKRLDDKTMDKIGRAVWKNAYLNKGVWKATKRMGFNQELRQTEENERLLKQLLELGGVSTYSTYFAKTETDLVKAVKTENSHLAKKLEQAGSLIEGYNKVFDTVSALSAYKAMIDNGVDPKQAAATTLELTNFRKTGSKMRGIKALYMFAQPTAMGARNLIKYLSTKKGQRRFVGYMVAMTSLYLALRAMDDEDEGGNIMDQLGDITRYIPLPLGDGKYFKFPVGFGMPQMAWNFSVNMVKAMVWDISFTEAGTNMAVHTTKTLAPVSPSEISAAKYPLQKLALTFTPTILQPLMQNVVNRSAFGNVITPNFVVDHKLKAEQSKSTTAQFWQDLALEIHDSFGFDMHPEQIKNFVEGYAPILGSLRELQTVFIENPNREQLGRRTRTPFVNQLIGTTNEFAIQSRYYEASEEAQAFAKSYKSRLERGVAEPLNSKEKMIVAWHDLNQRRMRELRTEKGKATKALNKGTITPSVYDARIKAYNKQMDGVQRVLLKRWREINGLNTN